ncbi:type II toxin-antitoxin system RelE/ParE family toxin [Stenotrophomonas pavanii]|uniref:type II toxin-antitoxin system RelE/ParE family toxin n=1 Tax=Stenotrophomonas pavanii TaxID=487698 RepID=UPI0039C63C7E
MIHDFAYGVGVKIYQVRITASAQGQLDAWEFEHSQKFDWSAADAYIDDFVEDARTLSDNPLRGTLVTVGGNVFRQITGSRTLCRISYDVDEDCAYVDVLDFRRARK